MFVGVFLEARAQERGRLLGSGHRSSNSLIPNTTIIIRMECGMPALIPNTTIILYVWSVACQHCAVCHTPYMGLGEHEQTPHNTVFSLLDVIRMYHHRMLSLKSFLHSM